MDNESLFIGFIDDLYSSGKSYDLIGRTIKSVRHFLLSGVPLTRKGYKEYVKNNAVKISEVVGAKDAILSFLFYSGVGYKRVKKEKAIKPLERRSVVEVRNRRLINDFILFMTEDKDYSRSTLQTYRYGLESFFRYSNEFSADYCRRYIQTLEAEGMKPSTIRLRITALEKFGEFLKKNIKIKRPKFTRRLDVENVPNRKEYQILLDYLNTKGNKDCYYWIKILATTGARISEFLQFRWEDIERGDVVLKGKGSKYRRFFFTKALQAEIIPYMRANNKTGPVCVSRFGSVMTSRGFSENLKNWGIKCGIDEKKMHPHAFRHFFAKMYLEKNKDVIQLAELLGHGSIDTTRIYLQKTYEEQKRDFNRNVTW